MDADHLADQRKDGGQRVLGRAPAGRQSLVQVFEERHHESGAASVFARMASASFSILVNAFLLSVNSLCTNSANRSAKSRRRASTIDAARTTSPRSRSTVAKSSIR